MIEPMPMRRVFFALWPSLETAQALASCASTYQSGRLMQVESLHLTLAFTGNIPAARLPDLLAVGDAMAKTFPEKGFDLQLDRVGVWSHNRILWAGMSQPPSALTTWVRQLREAIVDAGFAADPQAFTPHVTLMRKVPAALADTSVEVPIRWAVRDWCLAESLNSAQSGPYYEILARWPRTETL